MLKSRCAAGAAGKTASLGRRYQIDVNQSDDITAQTWMMDSQWRDARSEVGMPLIDDGCWSHVAWSYAGGAEGVGVEGAGRQMQRNSKSIGMIY